MLKQSGNKFVRSVLLFGLVVALAPLTVDALSTITFFQGFETDTTGWVDNGGTVNRVASGYSSSYADQIDSAAGAYHARLGLDTGSGCSPGSASCGGPYTLWGGSSPGVPIGHGSVTQLDIYLDVDFAASHPDYRFDWDSALSDSNGDFLQDYIFNAGTANPSQVPACAPSGSNAYFVISASNNSQRGSAYPQNPGKIPQCITQSGWYTFRHTFREDAGGNLEVDMDILNSSGARVATWTMHPTCLSTQDNSGLCTSGDSLPFSAVGYNRYGWFPDQEIGDLAIDNTLLAPLPQAMSECKNGGWRTLGFKNQGLCVAFVVSHSSKH